MGGCATKPNVLKEEREAPKPVEDVAAAAVAVAVAVDDTPKNVSAGEESKEEAVDGRKSLGNFFTEKEAEENTATVSGEKPTEDAKLEQQDEEKKATEASEVKADTAAADEEKQ